jgi:hypothetical protein
MVLLLVLVHRSDYAFQRYFWHACLPQSSGIWHSVRLVIYHSLFLEGPEQYSPLDIAQVVSGAQSKHRMILPQNLVVCFSESCHAWSCFA